jgi:NADH-quinone oxidoreductase subunit L
VHSNEMNDMGGLRKQMPITHITFLLACLAIAGIPPFAGFFSKEEILQAAFNSNKLIYGVALLTAAITAFYMFRLYFSIFWKRESQAHEHHHGEGTSSMMVPLIILGAGAVLAGVVPFAKFITSDGLLLETEMHLSFSIAPVLLAAVGILLARRLYQKENALPDKISTSVSGIYKMAYHKFYIDEIYLFFTKKIIFNLIGRPAAWIDRNIVDGLMNLLASITSAISFLIKGLQSGKVQNYAVYFFAGVVGFALVFIYLWK